MNEEIEIRQRLSRVETDASRTNERLSKVEQDSILIGQQFAGISKDVAYIQGQIDDTSAAITETQREFFNSRLLVNDIHKMATSLEALVIDMKSRQENHVEIEAKMRLEMNTIQGEVNTYKTSIAAGWKVGIFLCGLILTMIATMWNDMKSQVSEGNAKWEKIQIQLASPQVNGLRQEQK